MPDVLLNYAKKRKLPNCQRSIRFSATTKSRCGGTNRTFAGQVQSLEGLPTTPTPQYMSIKKPTQTFQPEWVFAWSLIPAQAFLPWAAMTDQDKIIMVFPCFLSQVCHCLWSCLVFIIANILVLPLSSNIEDNLSIVQVHKFLKNILRCHIGTPQPHGCDWIIRSFVVLSTTKKWAGKGLHLHFRTIKSSVLVIRPPALV